MMSGSRVPGPAGTYQSSGTRCRAPGALPGSVARSRITDLSASQKVAEAIRRAAGSLPNEAGSKLLSLLSPQALGALTAVLVIWAGSHAFGVGEAADILLLATGLVFIGSEAFDAIRHLIDFGRVALSAESEADLDCAGRHLAAAIAIIGINAVIIFLTRGAAKAVRGRYRPTVTGDATLPAGEGWTNKYGDIRYSTEGSAENQALVQYHESVHSFLSPKLMQLRELRANWSMAAYEKSAFLRYLEEATAESYAQLRVNGIKGLPAGIRFPIANGYVTLRAVAAEAAVGAAFGVIVVGGIRYLVYVESGE